MLFTQYCRNLENKIPVLFSKSILVSKSGFEKGLAYENSIVNGVLFSMGSYFPGFTVLLIYFV